MNKLAFKARIFQERGDNIWDNRNGINNLLVFCMLVILGLILFNGEKFNNLISGSILLMLLIFKLALMVSKFGIEEKSNLEGGFLEIMDDEIRFKGNKIKISDISSINLEINNYYKALQYRSPNDMRPFYAQGFDNSLTLTTKNKENFSLRFQLENEKHKDLLIPFSYHLITNKVITAEKGALFLKLKKAREKEIYFKNLEKFKKHN